MSEESKKTSPPAAEPESNALTWVLVTLVSFIFIFSIGIGIYVTWDMWSFGPTDPDDYTDTGGGEGLSEDFVIAATEDFAAQTSAFAAAFVDLAGDPMIIRFSEADTAKTTRELPPPLGVPRERVPSQLILVNDIMVSGEARFVTTLPSSAEDFAFFQTQRNNRATEEEEEAAEEIAAQEAEASTVTDASLTDADGGWGEALEETTQEVSDFEETRIENTTSIGYVRPQELRDKLARDIFVRPKTTRKISDLMIDNGFFPVDAEAAGKAAKELWGFDEVKVGTVVAMRGQPQLGDKLSLLQMSVYDSEVYYGTLAKGDDGLFGEGSDPWFEDDLFNYVEGQEEEAVEQKYRLLDAFYSAAIRNKVPAQIVGESIALLSKSNDLDAFAAPGDRMTLLYAKERGAEDTGTGQILYIAINGKDAKAECFVYRTAPGKEYACYELEPKAGVGGAGGQNGMVTPVKGVMTSRFGPRKHPVLKTVRQHKGVDWAAPTGTPIVAAFDGTVAYAGDGRGYGNLIKLRHPGGRETRYAHMHKFNVKQGATVRAGDVIGFVGTTGLSTGPHLHFELYLNGVAIDPMNQPAGGSAIAAIPTGKASAAVETLVNQIIRVESAGNARAKNPLSTATGLGQFIESTWLRMMRDYRPDLAGSLSRAELLDLRFDPTISRQMVTNLAREGESYLRARGHGITAGRLYLCHFLGAAGAHKVLSNPDDADLLVVLGAGVINANPFLKGRDVAYIKNWAERKMRGGGAVTITNAPTAPVVIREPKGLPEYRKLVTGLIRVL
ncbi:peptidoglycan DD-metalloendopeptidase family protein [Alphaproteobacteria bacterium KMM 3653]|uniref:Peptidoglycan DD-metalloendopeptidase family protein n=1 Tax=Harenicola maris TaxID=2841044 RepID=A0AAP2CPB7_9RHOB|nr:peptidoglycan DD-metalloendopeptidase family protein [Harenicola maris]